MEQLGFDLALEGAEKAAAKADRLIPNWSEKALAAFRLYAMKHRMFTTEDVVIASVDVPTPPEKRAWGNVATAAKNLGICRKVDGQVANSRLRHAHSRTLNLWHSNIYAPEKAA